MDPAVRASLKGWEFLFVGDVKVKNELPNTFNAYRYQQHSGHLVQLLFKKMSKEILLCKVLKEGITFEETSSYLCFLLCEEDHRTLVTFFFYCIVILSCVLIPEVSLKKQIAIYIQATITILNALSTPRSIHLLVSWILFENVMSHHRTKATITGLLKVNRVNEWVATEKLENALKQRNNTRPSSDSHFPFRIIERINPLEIIMGMYMLHCAIYDLLFGHDHFFVYLLLQAGAFFTMGFGQVGTFVRN
ncbi:hypothetical protein HN51_040373 [Arachis hypogaea]